MPDEKERVFYLATISRGKNRSDNEKVAAVKDPSLIYGITKPVHYR